MAEATIQAVLQAESDAQKWETDARQQAEDIVEKAREDAKRLIVLAEEQAWAERQQQIEKVKSDAENTARTMAVSYTHLYMPRIYKKAGRGGTA